MATPTAAPDRPASVASDSALQHGLTGMMRRMRLLRAQRWAARGVVMGSLVALLLLALSRAALLPLLLDLSLPVFVLIAYVLCIGACLFPASRQRIDSLALARYAEQQMGLKERLSSALTLEDQSGDVLVRLQRDDAAQYATSIDPRKLIPWRWTWELPVALVSVLIVLLAALLPASPLAVTAPDRVARTEVAREGRALEDVAREVLRQSDQTAPPSVKEAARRLQQIAKAMQTRHATKAQAVRDLQELSEQIKKTNQQTASSVPGSQSLPTDKSAQARADAQRELDRALNADVKGAPASGRDQAANAAHPNSGPGKTDGSAKAGTSGTASASSHDASTGNASSRQGNANGAIGQKQTATGAHGSSSAQIRKDGASGKPGPTASKPGAAAKPGTFSPTASPKATPMNAKQNASTQSQTQGHQNQKTGPSPKGKDYGKSVPPSGQNPASQQQATQGEMLGDKLRRYADKIAQRPMASGERGQAAGSLDQLNQKLNDAHMPETQKHVQAAAQALREGRQQDAVSELRKAAEAADRETLVTQRETTGQSASEQTSSSSGSQGASQMQRAVDQSKQNLSGQGKQSGSGKSGQSGAGNPEQGQPSQGSPGQRPGQQGSGLRGSSQGAGTGKTGSPGTNQANQDGQGRGGTGRGGAHPGSPHPISGSIMTDGSGKIVLRPIASGGRMIEKPVPGKEIPGSVPSTVPYYNVPPQFKKAAEKDSGTENIPPAYRQQIKKYFDSLTPPHR